MILKNVRCDWVYIKEANNKGKFSMTPLIPKDHPQLSEIKAAIEKARITGISKNKFSEADTKKSAFKSPLHDGDAEMVSEGLPKYYANTVFIRAYNAERPGIPISQSAMLDKFYSGAYFNLDIAFYPFNTESKGVGVGLNNVMWVADSERLDGRMSAEDAFKGMEVEEDGTDLT